MHKGMIFAQLAILIKYTVIIIVSYSTDFFQVGKFMKCKWHSELNDSDFQGSPSETQNTFTTVSHSCQVFVSSVR